MSYQYESRLSKTNLFVSQVSSAYKSADMTILYIIKKKEISEDASICSSWKNVMNFVNTKLNYSSIEEMRHPRDFEFLYIVTKDSNSFDLVYIYYNTEKSNWCAKAFTVDLYEKQVEKYVNLMNEYNRISVEINSTEKLIKNFNTPILTETKTNTENYYESTQVWNGKTYTYVPTTGTRTSNETYKIPNPEYNPEKAKKLEAELNILKKRLEKTDNEINGDIKFWSINEL